MSECEQNRDLRYGESCAYWMEEMEIVAKFFFHVFLLRDAMWLYGTEGWSTPKEFIIRTEIRFSTTLLLVRANGQPYIQSMTNRMKTEKKIDRK